MGQERQAAGMRAQSGLVRYPSASTLDPQPTRPAAAPPARAAPGD